MKVEDDGGGASLERKGAPAQSLHLHLNLNLVGQSAEATARYEDESFTIRGIMSWRRRLAPSASTRASPAGRGFARGASRHSSSQTRDFPLQNPNTRARRAHKLLAPAKCFKPRALCRLQLLAASPRAPASSRQARRRLSPIIIKHHCLARGRAARPSGPLAAGLSSAWRSATHPRAQLQ